MSACETCWADAYMRSRVRGGLQVDHYRDLLAERDGSDCTLPDPAREDHP